MKYAPNRSITKAKLLLGEGIEEVYFFQALLQHMGISDVQVDQYGGKTRLPSSLLGLAKRSGFAEVLSLGITRDADFLDTSELDNSTAVRGAFDSVCESLRKARLPVPNGPLTKVEGKPSVTVFILPDCHRPGMLEDLCVDCIQSEPDFQCVEEYINCAERLSGRAQQRNMLPKARVGAWLATQPQPGLRLGEAAQKGSLDWDKQGFSKLKDFLRSI